MFVCVLCVCLCQCCVCVSVVCICVCACVHTSFTLCKILLPSPVVVIEMSTLLLSSSGSLMARSQWCPHPHDQHAHHRPRDFGAKVSQRLWSFSSVTGVVLMKFSCGGKVCVTISSLKEMQCERFSEYACQPLFPPFLLQRYSHVTCVCMLCVCL